MELKKARENLLVMVFFAAVCIFLFAYVIPHQIPLPAAAANQTFTPRTFPYLLAGGLAVCTGIGLVNGSRAYLRVKKAMEAAGEKEEKIRRTKKEWLEELIPYIVYAMVILYGVLIKFVGFIWSTVVLPPAILLLLRDKKWYHYAIFYAFAAIMFTIFKVVLKVPLP